MIHSCRRGRGCRTFGDKLVLRNVWIDRCGGAQWDARRGRLGAGKTRFVISDIVVNE